MMSDPSTHLNDAIEACAGTNDDYLGKDAMSSTADYSAGKDPGYLTASFRIGVRNIHWQRGQHSNRRKWKSGSQISVGTRRSNRPRRNIRNWRLFGSLRSGGTRWSGGNQRVGSRLSVGTRRSAKKQRSGKAFKPNGCSVPYKLPFFYKKMFTPACNKHDNCYYYKRYSRKVCDKKFLKDMKAICRRKSRRKLACLSFANLYYGAVRVGGRPHYG